MLLKLNNKPHIHTSVSRWISASAEVVGFPLFLPLALWFFQPSIRISRAVTQNQPATAVTNANLATYIIRDANATNKFIRPATLTLLYLTVLCWKWLCFFICMSVCLSVTWKVLDGFQWKWTCWQILFSAGSDWLLSTLTRERVRPSDSHNFHWISNY